MCYLVTKQKRLKNLVQRWFTSQEKEKLKCGRKQSTMIFIIKKLTDNLLINFTNLEWFYIDCLIFRNICYVKWVWFVLIPGILTLVLQFAGFAIFRCWILHIWCCRNYCSRTTELNKPQNKETDRSATHSPVSVDWAMLVLAQRWENTV